MTIRENLVHLIDDDEDVRRSLARLLSSGGYIVREYESGDAFLNAIDSVNAGFILLDIRMPGTDGISVLRILSERKFELPVIMMTGSGELTILAFKAGAIDLMQKPFGRHELLSVLERHSYQ